MPYKFRPRIHPFVGSRSEIESVLEDSPDKLLDAYLNRITKAVGEYREWNTAKEYANFWHDLEDHLRDLGSDFLRLKGTEAYQQEMTRFEQSGNATPPATAAEATRQAMVQFLTENEVGKWQAEELIKGYLNAIDKAFKIRFPAVPLRSFYKPR